MLNSAWTFLDSPAPLAFAHRGVHLDVPENSRMSFSAAVQLGYRYIETDVRCTADNKVIVFHDARARRITGLNTRISSLTFSELQSAAKASGVGDIPLLLDILEEFPGLRFNIDVKDWRAAELVPKIVQQNAACDRVCINSFSAARIRCVRTHLTDAVCTGAPVSEFLHFLIRPNNYAKASQPAVLQLPLSTKGIPVVTRKLIDKAHKMGLPVHVWTLNDLPTIQQAIQLKVDGIMTDEPILLKDELIRCDLWR